MNVLILLVLVAVAVLIVMQLRIQRDRELLRQTVTEKGGQVSTMRWARRGHPFAEAGRGWWAWQVKWQGGSAVHTSWALTTKEGLKEWRD